MQIEVYCDESSQEHFYTRPPGDFYVLIGSIWAIADQRDDIKQSIHDLRKEHGIHGEAKWGRVSKGALPFYKALVDLFFNSDLRFRVMVIRTDELDLKLHDDSPELMLYKFYYFMLRGWLDDLNEYRIFTDVRTNRVCGRLNDLKRILSFANLTSTIEVQAIPSQESALMQIADVLTGAVSYKFHRRSKSQSKVELVSHIEEHLGHGIMATAKAEDKFNVFRIKPGGGW